MLRLGSDESTAMVALSEILSQLKRGHPKLIVELSIDVGTKLKEKLRRREIDIAAQEAQERLPPGIQLHGLPEIGRGLGKGIKNFKDSTKESAEEKS